MTEAAKKGTKALFKVERGELIIESIMRKRVAVFIDETNTGGIDQGDEYVVGATVIQDSFFEYNKGRFEEITRKRFRALNEDIQKKKEELKFADEPDLREPVLKDMSILHPNVYAATVTKPMGAQWKKNQQRDVHRNAVFHLMKEISKKEYGKDIDLTIDEVDKLGKGTLENMRKDLMEIHRGELIFRIGNSKNDFGLQTNDFGVGAMGKKFNRGEIKWIKYLKTEINHTHISEEEALRDTARKTVKMEKCNGTHTPG